VKKILIAHQSTIPHYRVPFYNELEKLRPVDWTFNVVFDSYEINSKNIFSESVNVDQFKFPVLQVRTLFVKISQKSFKYQTFFLKALHYDLLVLDNALNNLTYPLCFFFYHFNKPIILWGHDKDREITELSGYKIISEKIKQMTAKNSKGFFAYTNGTKESLVQQGVDSKNIFVLNNTIDILEQRNAFQKYFPQREQIRNELGVKDKKVLLFVGRFIPKRRLDFLVQSFLLMNSLSIDFQLFVVGSGNSDFLGTKNDNINFFGSITNIDQLARLYVASDVYVIPGCVGLGPLQAMCFDLPIVTIESPFHGPEIEYLTSENSIVMDKNTTPDMYAKTVIALLSDPIQLQILKSKIWKSISHLTIENMARNFIEGINTVIK